MKKLTDKGTADRWMLVDIGVIGSYGRSLKQ
jgi:hypothetical protein